MKTLERGFAYMAFRDCVLYPTEFLTYPRCELVDLEDC